MVKICKLFFIIFLATNTGITHANDTHIVVGAGGVGYYSDTEDEYISLEYEKIIITLFDDHYKINVDFIFTNSSNKTLEYEIGFPVISRDAFEKNKFIQGMIPCDGFNTSVNGIKAEFLETIQSNEKGISKWYVKKVQFTHNANTAINIQYDSKYGLQGGLGSGYTATYFYGSAYIWKGPIKKLDVIITNKSSFNINKFQSSTQTININQISFMGSEQTSITFTDIKPSKDAVFNLSMSIPNNIALYDSTLDWVNNHYVYKPEQYYFLTAKQLRLARNFFYAINGLIFKSADLTLFFSKMPWYNPQYSNVDDKLCEEAKKAIQGIIELEQRRQ